MVEHKDCAPMLVVKYSAAACSDASASSHVMGPDFAADAVVSSSVAPQRQTTIAMSRENLKSISVSDSVRAVQSDTIRSTACPWSDPVLKKTSPGKSSNRIESIEPCGQKENRLKMPGGPLRPEELCQVSSSKIRTKVSPCREMNAALKVINDALLYKKQQHHRDTASSSTTFAAVTRRAKEIVQLEWFQISSTEHANPLDVEDYLDCFEEFSNDLLRYMVNMNDQNGNTAMHYAVSHGNFDVVSILLDSKLCDVNHANNAGFTCVMLVSLAQLKVVAHYTVVQRLFQLSDVNVRAKKSQTALMLAVSQGNLDMVQMLLAAGADINIQDQDGNTALMCAAEHGRIDIVKLLLAQSDCDSTIFDVNGSTAQTISAEAGHSDISTLLSAHEHIARSKTSPCTSLRRKKIANKALLRSATGGSLTAGGSASMPSSPMPTTKFRHGYLQNHVHVTTRDSRV